LKVNSRTSPAASSAADAIEIVGLAVAALLLLMCEIDLYTSMSLAL
jgi:hypothetical protein